jgi:hypothetical protein
MQWPWRKKLTEFVPIPAFGRYEDMHQDGVYLRDLENIASSKVWLVEMAQLLKEAREMADVAAVPDELKGIQKIIGLIRIRLVVGDYAKRALSDLAVQTALNKEE